MRIWHWILGLLIALRPHAASAEVDGVQRGFLDRQLTISGIEYRYQIYVPSGWTRTSPWPVILALHGAGGYGSDGKSQTKEGLGPAIRRHPERFPALVVFPQSPAHRTPGWQGIGGHIALAALDKTMEDYRGDSSRVTLTGLSIGGNGAWYLAYHDPSRFAGLLVVCGFVAERMGSMYPILYPSLVPGVTDPSEIVAQRLVHIPTWIFHGDADRTVPVEHSRRMFTALRELGAPVQYTELPGVDHNAWDSTYDRPDVASWLLQQRRVATVK